MKDNFGPSLIKLLNPDREGGFVNHPKDPGGMTNLGVTQRAWAEWVGHPVSEKEMRALTVEKVSLFYKRKYWDKVAGDLLPAGLDHAVFDFAVNSGPGRAAKFLQELLGVTPDGAIGPQTLKALAKYDPKLLVEQYLQARQDFLEGLETFTTFGNGWSRRVSEVKAEALQMLA